MFACVCARACVCVCVCVFCVATLTEASMGRGCGQVFLGGTTKKGRGPFGNSCRASVQHVQAAADEACDGKLAAVLGGAHGRGSAEHVGGTVAKGLRRQGVGGQPSTAHGRVRTPLCVGACRPPISSTLSQTLSCARALSLSLSLSFSLPPLAARAWWLCPRFARNGGWFAAGGRVGVHWPGG